MLVNPGGEPITDAAAAERYKATLARDHGCTDLRIQVIDLSQPFDFARMAMDS